MATTPNRQTGSQSNVAFSNTAVTLFAAAGQMVRRTVYNDADQPMLISINGAASATNFMVKVAAGGYFEFPIPLFGGTVSVIWLTATTGAARIAQY